jgi:hypothetical protein
MGGIFLPVGAAELTFDQSQPVVDGEPVNQAYGDAVSTTQDGPFRYRGGQGFAPHVVVDYGPAGAAPAIWTMGYGSLVNVLYTGDEFASTLDVTLTGETGWSVVLHSFDLAAVAAATLDAVQVVDGLGNVLFESNNQVASETSQTTIVLDPPLESLSLTIKLDLSNLSGASDSVGIDNIRYSERGPVTFRDGRTVAGAEGPSRTLLADFDGDGDTDLLAASFGDGLAWYENVDGEGSFGTGRVIDDEVEATGAAVADLDDDGDLDVIASWDSGAKVTWYENLDGDFGDPLTNERVISGALDASSVVVADIDRDGDLDVLSTSRVGGSASWHENDGTPADGGWTDHTITSLAGARHATASDLDRDGDLDVLVASELGPVFSWYENLGGGNFGNPLANQRVIPNGAQGGRSIVSADLDGDGDPDAVTASCDDDTIAWHPNLIDTPSGDFDSAELISSTADCPVSLFATDLDLDGDLDVLAASSDGAVQWFKNAGAGAFTSAIGFPGSATGGSDIRTADVDRDGDPDVVAAFGGVGRIELFENRTIHRSGRLDAQTFFDLSLATEIVSADVDRDGDVDAISGQRSGGGFVIRLHENDGQGGFNSSDIAMIGLLEDLAIADVDGDGDDDLLAANDELSWFENTDGAGAFGGTPVVISTGGASDTFRSLASADLDEDGDLDVLVGGFDSLNPILSWFESDGTPADGGWTEHALSVGFERVFSVEVADLNQDGDLDIIATAGSSIDLVTDACATCSVVWFVGDADQQPAQFVAQTPIVSRPGLDAVRVVDGGPFSARTWIDPVAQSASTDFRQDDRDPDLALGTDNTFVFHENRLDEASADFAPGRALFFFDPSSLGFTGPEGFVESIEIEDLNHDGRSDGLFTLDASGGALGDFAFHQVRGDNVGAPTSAGLALNELPRELATADLDGDGDPDLLTAQEGQREYSTGPGVAHWTNLGGQYSLFTDFEGCAQLQQQAACLDEPATAAEGELKVIEIHAVGLNAIAGDSTARLEAFDVLFTDASSTPLTSAQANALIENLLVYRDSTPCVSDLDECTDSAVFTASEDILVGTIDELDLDPEGAQSVSLPGGDPNLLVASPTAFFVVAEIALGAANQTPREFVTAHRSGSFVLKDALTGSPLSEELPQTINLVSNDPVFISQRVDVFSDGADVAPGDGDCDAGGGACTLRAAIQEANLRPGPDRIVLGPGTYTLSIPGVGEDAALTGDLDLGGQLSIVGAGPDLTIIDGGGLDRVFDDRASFNDLSNLSIVNGSVTGSFPDGLGGGVRILAQASIRNCSITQNEAYEGGGIGVNGVLFIENSLVSGNVAETYGGGLFLAADVLLEMNASTVSDNTAADHGGISNNSVEDVFITTSTISGNQAIASASGAGDAGGIGNNGVMTLTASTIFGNSAVTDGGLSNCDSCAVPGIVTVSLSIIAGNEASGANPDCGGTLSSAGFNLIQDTTGCSVAGSQNVFGLDPLLGPLQDNGGPTPTHALLEDSPAIDAAFCSGGPDQRGSPRTDLPGVPNPAGSNGCDIGAYEVSIVETLPTIEVPIRWCAVEGSPSFGTPAVQEDVNAGLRERHELASNNVFEPGAAIRFRSAANAEVRDFPILSDPDTMVGNEGDVVIDPASRNYREFLELVAACRVAWESIDPKITGITAVNINRFVDPQGNPLDVLGMGGRAAFGSVAEQMEAGRVMVVDRSHREADPIDRLLGHELGHAAGALRHGDGLDNLGLLFQCGNGIIDDNDDQCASLARFDGTNLMQYRTGTGLTLEQVLAARAHILATIPDTQDEVTSSAEADEVPIDEEFVNIFEFEFVNVFDFEFVNIFDFEFVNVFDFEFVNIFDFEFVNVFDFEFVNVFDFGMDFTVTDPVTGDGETTVFAALGGPPWPTPVRPPVSYFWYLDLDEDQQVPGSGDSTGGLPVGFGFAGSASGDSGVDVIVQLDLYSHCDQITLVCNDFALKTVFAFDPGDPNDPNDPDEYVIGLGPITAVDAIRPISVGLVQETTDPELEDPGVGFVIAPTFPNDILINAVPGYRPGDPVAIEVVAAIACELTLPDGTAVDCQCTDCLDCPDYPGCEVAGGTPDAIKVCSVGMTSCVTDGDCSAGDVCSGERSCSVGGNCVSNADCTAGDTDFCGGAALLPADSPAGQLAFEPPVLPSCAVDPAVPEQGQQVTIFALDFPTDTGRAMRVLIDGDVIPSDPTLPAFDPVTGEAELTATIPLSTPIGSADLTVELEGVATAADCTVRVKERTNVPPAIVAISAPIDPLEIDSPVPLSAEFIDQPGDSHTAEWDWGDGTTSAGTVTEPSDPTPGTVAGSHEYTEPGVYTVRLTVTDSFGAIGERQFQFIVVFDPDGGFATGGGFIDSPPGSYGLNPALVGRGHFGFNCKYHNGATVPTGNTKFDFKGASLKFKATEYEWLVVNGHKAQFKGSGTIDGEGNYGFLVTAIDEKLTPSLNVDGFRIRIWDKDDDDAVVYDNRMGEDDFSDAATELSGGSVVIHDN